LTVVCSSWDDAKLITYKTYLIEPCKLRSGFISFFSILASESGRSLLIDTHKKVVTKRINTSHIWILAANDQNAHFLHDTGTEFWSLVQRSINAQWTASNLYNCRKVWPSSHDADLCKSGLTYTVAWWRHNHGHCVLNTYIRKYIFPLTLYPRRGSRGKYSSETPTFYQI
jgi:hypothetical protein